MPRAMMSKRVKITAEDQRLFRTFRIALLFDVEDGRKSKSVQQWAEERDVLASHVYHVMEGHAISDRIMELMRIYSAEILKAHKVTIGTDSGSAAA